jgi:hypothetical protein
MQSTTRFQIRAIPAKPLKIPNQFYNHWPCHAPHDTASGISNPVTAVRRDADGKGLMAKGQ